MDPVLHRRAAAGGVDDDRVDAGLLERLDERPPEPLRLGLTSVVRRQRAAAALRPRRHDVEPLRAQHPGRGGVDTGEELALHAAEEQADDAATGAAGRGPLGHRLAGLQRRRQPLHRRERRRDPVEGARPAQQSRQPGPLVEPQRSPRRPQPLRVGEQREDALAEGLVGAGPLVAALHLRAGVLDDPVVLHARRAGGHAGHAAEAGVDVLHQRVGHRRALEALVHQVDPAARRVHLLAPQHVGRTAGQAEPAVDALGDQRPAMVSGARRRRAPQGWPITQIPPDETAG